VQLTPPGSVCSIALGKGVGEAPRGSVKGLQLVVDDIEEAHAELSGRGVDVSEIQDFPWGRFVFFADPDARHGITVERLLTDNGSAYRSTLHAIACRTLGIRHLRTRAYRPQDQRQGRALHPHHARRLGLRPALQHQPRTDRSP